MRRAWLLVVASLLASGCLSALPGGVPFPPGSGGRPLALPGTASCSFPCAVTVANGTYREFEPSITFDPLDPMTVAVSAAEDLIADAPGYVETPFESPVTGSKGLLQTPGSYRIGIHTSHDGGLTWATRFLPWLGNAAPLSQWNLYCVYGDPILFYGPDGVLHVVAVAAQCATELKADQTFHLIHAASPDDGATWGEPSLIWPGQLLAFADDKPWAAIDPNTGRIAVSWTGFIGLGIGFQGLMVRLSDDGGATWGLPSIARTAGGAELLVDTPALDEPFYNWWSAVGFGQDGAVHVAYLGFCDVVQPVLDNTPNCIALVTSDDDGATWQRTPVSPITHPNRPGARQVQEAYPALAVDRSGGPRDGRLYVAYMDMASGDYDALLGWSDNGGETWSAPQRLSTDAPGNGKDQFHVALAVDPQGVVHAGYWDRRHDPANRAIQMTWARWDPATGLLQDQALEAPWDPDPGDIGGQFLGDYSMAAAQDARVGFAWDVATAQKPGTRNTNIPWDLDLRAAVVAS